MASSVAEVGHTDDHAVVVYDHDAALVGALHEFVEAGLAADQVCVVVVTPWHRDGLERALRDAGWDVAAARARGNYVPLDAATTLAGLMVDGVPQREAFRRLVVPVVAGGDPAGDVRIFAEMVTLLWAEGDVVGALGLEELWHELADSYPFASLCGYPSHAFAGEEGIARYQQVCDAHKVVLTTDGVSLPHAGAGIGTDTAAATDTLSVLLVDPHELTLAGLAAMLGQEGDVEVVATASTVEAAVAAAVRQPPEVVVLDPELGAEDGLQLLDRLHDAGLKPPTVVLAATDELAAVQQALGAGVDSYVAKQARYPVVVDAIRRTAAGETVLPPELVFQLVAGDSVAPAAVPARPTVCEQRVLEHLSEGLTNEQIAAQPDMPSVRTVQKHLENLLYKLDAANRVQLIVTAHRRGLLR